LIRVAVLRPDRIFTAIGRDAPAQQARAAIVLMAANFAMLGLGYAEARDEIARDRLASGVSIGVVMGADGRKPSLVESYFWENSAETNVAD